VGQVAGDVFPRDGVGGNLPAQMGAEAGVGPGQQVGHHLFVNGLLVLEQPQDLVPEELFENLRVGGGVHGEEDPVSRKQAPGDQQMDIMFSAALRPLSPPTVRRSRSGQDP